MSVTFSSGLQQQKNMQSRCARLRTLHLLHEICSNTLYKRDASRSCGEKDIFPLWIADLVRPAAAAKLCGRFAQGAVRLGILSHLLAGDGGGERKNGHCRHRRVGPAPLPSLATSLAFLKNLFGRFRRASKKERCPRDGPVEVVLLIIPKKGIPDERGYFSPRR